LIAPEAAAIIAFRPWKHRFQTDFGAVLRAFRVARIPLRTYMPGSIALGIRRIFFRRI